MDCITKYDAIAVEGALIKFLMPLANEETNKINKQWQD